MISCLGGVSVNIVKFCIQFSKYLYGKYANLNINPFGDFLFKYLEKRNKKGKYLRIKGLINIYKQLYRNIINIPDVILFIDNYNGCQIETVISKIFITL